MGEYSSGKEGGDPKKKILKNRGGRKKLIEKEMIMRDGKIGSLK